MELLVPIASVATLRLLWLVQISKHTFSCEWPGPLPRDQAVDLVLRLGACHIVLPARVRTCSPAGGRYHVNLILSEMSTTARAQLDSLLSGSVATSSSAASARA
jgi:hypothetical protein